MNPHPKEPAADVLVGCFLVAVIVAVVVIASVVITVCIGMW